LSLPPMCGDLDVDAARSPLRRCLAAASMHPHAASLAKGA